MFSVKFASRHILAWNFEMAPRFVENLFAPGYKHQLTFWRLMSTIVTYRTANI